MGAMLVAAGDAEHRYALPNSRFMVHQPLGGAEGQATDVEIRTKELLRIKEQIIDILARHTGNDEETIRKDIDRDNFMSAEEALEYGLVDEVLESRSEVEEKLREDEE